MNNCATAIPNFVESDGCCRSSIPEDQTQQLVKDIYDRLVWVSPERRRAALRAVAAIYEVEI